MVKIRTKREIDLISESCQIVADTVEMLFDYMIPGTSLLELDRLAEEYIRSQGEYLIVWVDPSVLINAIKIGLVSSGYLSQQK